MSNLLTPNEQGEGSNSTGTSMLEYLFLALLLVIGIIVFLQFIGVETSTSFSELGSGFGN